MRDRKTIWVEITEIERIQTLADYLCIDIGDDIEVGWDDNEFDVGKQSYKVLTDAEADEEVKDYIRESLWAFNASWIIEHSSLPYEAEEMVKSFQEEKCEGANETIFAMLDDFDDFVEKSISADGRGHFMSNWDGNENKFNGLFIYRTN